MTVGASLVLALVFTVIAGVGVAVPLVWAMTAGAAARGRLVALRDWLVRYQAVLMALVLLVIGVMLIGSGLEAL